MKVGFDRDYELLHPVHGGRIFDFGKHVCGAPPAADEFFGKGPEIDRLLRPITGASVKNAGSNFVFNDHTQFPPSGIMSCSDFERADCLNFTQVFAFSISQMKLTTSRDVLSNP